MNVHDPTTWVDLSTHPEFRGGIFDPEWYDGDLEYDLRLLREFAKEIGRVEKVKCTLHVLDDCTIYVEVNGDEQTLGDVYPAYESSKEDGKSYLVDASCSRIERLAETAEEAAAILLVSKCLERKIWPFKVLPEEEQTEQHKTEIAFMSAAHREGFTAYMFAGNFGGESIDGRRGEIVRRGVSRWEVNLTGGENGDNSRYIEDFSDAASSVLEWLRESRIRKNGVT